MTDRTRNGKTLAQDATAIVFCLVGGFFAVSVVRLLQGHEAKESFAALTRPVVALATALGAPAALALGLGLAALGGLLFVRSRALEPLRPLSALVLGALGLALVLGAFDAGGALGGWLPGLVGGLIGRVVGVILGAALAWLGWMVGLPPSAPRESTAEALQRIGLATRQDAAGVSPAEAALLGSDARSAGAAVALPRPAPGAKPAAAPRREEPLRSATLVPRAPAAPVRDEPRPAEPAAPSEAASSALTPPTPSWEALETEAEPADAPELGTDEPEESDEPAEVRGLSALRTSRAEVFPAREEAAEAAAEAEPDELEGPEDLDESGAAEEDADEEYAIPAQALDDDEDPEEEPEELLAQEHAEEEIQAETEAEEEELQAAEPPLPSAAWEQVGLFDELDERAPAAPERTPSFDFDPPAPPARAAPAAASRTSEDPFAAPAAPEADFTLTPAAPRPAPAGARDDAEERWQALVYEAGCLILDQKRVAVSMLERRFSIDFDAACKVLDELQQAGLIGPYIGGRSRDILLSREEWLSHAPHAS
ncbi:MAG TPA: DNA translocase FtsK [Planctomycetota bacterium]